MMPMAKNGGGVSGSCLKNSTYGMSGPIKTNLIGSTTAERVLFHSTGESLPVWRTESGSCGNPRGPVVPKSEVVTKRKTNPKTKNRIMNFFLEMFILYMNPETCALVAA
jgi:hypothetical protein